MSSFGFDFLHFPRKLWAFHSRLSVNWIKSSHTNQSIKCVVFLTSQWGRLFTFLCVVKILHSITIKGFFTQILVVALLQKNLLMLLAVRLSNYGCTWEVWRAIKKPRLELLLRIFRALQTSLLLLLTLCLECDLTSGRLANIGISTKLRDTI